MVTLLKYASILVCNNNVWSIESHHIAVENSKILGVDVECIPDRTINLNGKLLLPTFFNIHCHLGESLYKTRGSDWSILKYLDYTSDIVDNMAYSERELFWRNSAEKTVRLLRESGTVGFCAARSAEMARKHQMYTMSGYPLMLSSKLEQYYRSGFEGFARYITENQSPDSSIGIFLHSLYRSNKMLLNLAAKCFDGGAEFLTVHISEDQETRRLEISQFQQEPVFVLDQYKLLTEQSILVHGGYLSKAELSLIREHNAQIAICPISNQFLNTACIDVYALEDMGIRWCLATDGLATGKTLSLIDQATAVKRQFPLISNIRLLQAMTTIPAQAFGRSSYTGMIEKGTDASFLLLQGDKTDVEDVLEKLFTRKVVWQVVRF